jgi:hypothetical protein
MSLIDLEKLNAINTKSIKDITNKISLKYSNNLKEIF